MARIVVIHCEIDTDEPLGPQIVAARAAGLDWKIIQSAFRRAGLPAARSWLVELTHNRAREAPDAFVRDKSRSQAA